MKVLRCDRCNGTGKRNEPFYMNCELGGICEDMSDAACEACHDRAVNCPVCKGTGYLPSTSESIL